MKTIGLLGGMTCESSLLYYKLINEIARERLGTNHSAKSVMVSVDFAEIEPWMERGQWGQVQSAMVEASRQIEHGGADFLVLCTNTIHKFAEAIGCEIGIPILHIVDATAAAIKKTGLDRVGLLGTRFTMEEEFYSGRLLKKHGIASLTPDVDDRMRVHRIIMEELSRGIICEQSRDEYWRIIDSLVRRGAQGIILGCTEIPLLIAQDQGEIPLFDTTTIHARAAVDFSLEAAAGRP
ncbi:MAG: aspartate/glutamate racemase family protein [Candidatus Aminicenantes bacterium]|nr:aspartate/glutamate racemase family protein [Candidatus Aminicenantes bacterium]